jgi:hypothetical protein
VQSAPREEVEHVARLAELDHAADAARVIRGEDRDDRQADHDDDHLEEVGHRDRPHAAEQRVDEDHQRADHHSGHERDPAIRQQVENQSKRRDLGGDPAKVRDQDDDGAEDLHPLAVPAAIEVADRQQVHLVELPREEHPDQDQAHAGTDRVLYRLFQAAFDELARDAEHGLGAEPGGERRRDDHRERERAPGDGVVGGVLDARRRVQADSDRHQEIECDEADQRHGSSAGAAVRGNWRGL